MRKITSPFTTSVQCIDTWSTNPSLSRSSTSGQGHHSGLRAEKTIFRVLVVFAQSRSTHYSCDRYFPRQWKRRGDLFDPREPKLNVCR
jgi:hypothetical protein